MVIKGLGVVALVCSSVATVAVISGVAAAIYYVSGNTTQSAAQTTTTSSGGATTPPAAQTATTSSGGSTCRAGWTAIANGCFKDMNKKATFEDAKKICQEEGAYLPLFFNYEEVEEVKEILKTETTEYLVAATDQVKEGIWRMDYPPNCKVPWLVWVSGNPNNSVVHGDEGEDCVELIVAEGKMNDIHCRANPRWVVCHIRQFNSSCPSTRSKLCQSTEDCSEDEKCDSYCASKCQSHSDCAPPTNFCDKEFGVCACLSINQRCHGHQYNCCSGNCTNGLCHPNGSCTFDFHCAKVAQPGWGGSGTGTCDKGSCAEE